MDKSAIVKAALASRKKKPIEGSAIEEKSESKPFEKKEDAKAKPGKKVPFFQKAKTRGM